MRLERLTGEQARARAAELMDIYGVAFTEPPWNEDGSGVADFARRLATDTERPGFVAVLAGQDGRPLGFGTAWPTRSPFPTGRAYDRVRGELGEQAERLLVGALEVDELAVAPHARGRGLAGQILDLLCEGAQRSWLLTSPQASGAIRVYERLGWERLTGPEAKVAVFTRGWQAESI
ncbi:GNAT family N-acetyltransferase [Nonomuraea sp. B10E15]|uniref:GNAT family N-acetyltransferase n=1 Tax=Nonomuraea sp. B10E15 TaxID=3153560 RepID=UPI00325E1C78